MVGNFSLADSVLTNHISCLESTIHLCGTLYVPTEVGGGGGGRGVINGLMDS